MGLQDVNFNCKKTTPVATGLLSDLTTEPAPAAAAEVVPENCVRTFILHRNKPLFQTGEAVHGCVYYVCSGGFKIHAEKSKDVRNVTAFRLTGDILGLYVPPQLRYNCDAVALEDSMVRAVPRDQLRDALPDFLPALSRTLAREQAMGHLLRHAKRERRLAGFLLEVGKHQALRGYSATVLRLPMSWRDIASYLGITPEWVSRSLLHLKQLGLLLVEGRRVHLLDPSALRALAFTMSPPAYV